MTTPNDQSDEMLRRLEVGQPEHDAWLATGKALEDLTGFTWNDPHYAVLHASIVMWGERLAALRRLQTEKEIDQAMAAAHHTMNRSEGER